MSGYALAGSHVVTGGGFCQQIAESLFENGPGPRAQEISADAPIARVKNCLRHGSFPCGIHSLIERVKIDSWFLAVIREVRLRARDEPANQIHVRIVVHVYSDDDHALCFKLSSQLNNQGVFVTARFAPGSPKIHYQGLAAVFCEDLLVACEINYRRIWSFCSLRTGRLSPLPAVLRSSGMNRHPRKQERWGENQKAIVPFSFQAHFPQNAILSVYHRERQLRQGRRKQEQGLALVPAIIRS